MIPKLEIYLNSINNNYSQNVFFMYILWIWIFFSRVDFWRMREMQLRSFKVTPSWNEGEEEFLPVVQQPGRLALLGNLWGSIKHPLKPLVHCRNIINRALTEALNHGPIIPKDESEQKSQSGVRVLDNHIQVPKYLLNAMAQTYVQTMQSRQQPKGIMHFLRD